MSDLERSAPLEVRAAGRTLTGEAVRYGQQATDRPERFEPGAFQPLGDVHLNLQHDRAIPIADGDRLILTDTPQALEVRATLPDGAALTLVRRGALRGLSVEFRALDEHRDSNGVRVIEKARLEAIGLVDSGSYAGRLEVRRRGGLSLGGSAGSFTGMSFGGLSLRASVPAGARLRCECGGDALCKWATFIPEAIGEMMDRAFEGAIERVAAEIEAGVRPVPAGFVEGRAAGGDVIAAWGRYDRPLASVSRGTLRRSGRFGVEIDLPDDDNGRAVLAAHESTGVIVRPHLDMDASEYTQDGDTLTYSRAVVRAFIVSATDAREGWPAPELLPATPEPEPEPEERGRRRLWL